MNLVNLAVTLALLVFLNPGYAADDLSSNTAREASPSTLSARPSKSRIISAIKKIRTKRNPQLSTAGGSLAGRTLAAIDSQDPARLKAFETLERKKALAYSTLGKAAGATTAAGGVSLGFMGIFTLVGGNPVGLGVVAGGANMTVEGYHLFKECSHLSNKHAHAADLAKAAREAQAAGTYDKEYYESRAQHTPLSLEQLSDLAIASGSSKTQKRFEMKHAIISKFYASVAGMSHGTRLGGAVLITSSALSAASGDINATIEQASSGISMMFGTAAARRRFNHLSEEHKKAAQKVRTARLEREKNQPPQEVNQEHLPEAIHLETLAIKGKSTQGQKRSWLTKNKILPGNAYAVETSEADASLDDLATEDIAPDSTSPNLQLEGVCALPPPSHPTLPQPPSEGIKPHSKTKNAKANPAR